MIARTWEGIVPAAKEAAYQEFLAREVLPEIRATVGSRGVMVLRRAEGESVRFLVLSYWESREAILAFAGEDIERAHYRPAALEFLVDPAPFVTHYEILPGFDAPAG
jgi:heme-degrading monooxygenase HmoA